MESIVLDIKTLHRENQIKGLPMYTYSTRLKRNQMYEIKCPLGNIIAVEFKLFN